MQSRGSVTLMGLLAVLFVTTFFVASVFWGQQRLKEIENRIDAYLCFKEHIVLTRRYIGKIGKINIALKSAFMASLLPGGKIATETIHLLKKAQTTIHFSHIRRLSTLKYCSMKQKLMFIKNTPYKLTKGLIFRRKINGTTIIRRKKWKILVKKGDVLLRADWWMQSSLDVNSIPKTQEVASPWWNPSYGFL